MPLLTPEQLEQLRQIIRDASTAVAISTTGMAVSDDELQRLVEAGYVDPKDLHNVVLDSFELGRIMAAVPKAQGWTFQQLKSHLEKNPAELSPQERLAVDHLQARAGQFCVGLGTRAEGDLTLAAADLDQELADAFRLNIQNEAAQSIARRETVGRLTTRLRQMSGDWARDWGRIASTESQMAHQAGYTEATAKRYGTGARMAKIPEPTACPDCLRLYLDEDGKPRLETVEWWQSQGVANYGLKRADWKPVLGAAHPWCLLPGQEILTLDGYKPIEEISIGDSVLQDGGTWGRVTALFERTYYGDAVNLSLSNGRSLQVTKGHLLRGSCGHWQAVDLLQQGAKLLGARIPDSQNGPSFSKKKPLFACIFLGFDRAGVPVAAVHFNGEFARPVADIDEVSPDELIVLESGNPRLIQKPLNHDFKLRERSSLHGAESAGNVFIGINRPAARFVGSGGVTLALLGAHFFHADLLAFRTRALSKPSLMEALDNNPAGYPELVGYRQYGKVLIEVQGNDVLGDWDAATTDGDPVLSEALPHGGAGDSEHASDFVRCHLPVDVQIEEDVSGDFDLIAHVAVLRSAPEKYSGKCYNVTVDNTNTYISAGVISKNCQCQLAYAPDGWEFDENWDLVPVEEGAAEKSLRPTLKVQTLRKARKLHYRTTFRGLPISIENRKGSTRRWYDPHTDTHGETRMRLPYGYIRLTEGEDGDHVDCFLGPHEDATHVYVIHQRKAPHFDEPDEDKVMLGQLSASRAKRAYLQHFNDPRFFGSMDAIPVGRFVERVLAGKYRDGKRIEKAGGTFGGSAGLVGTSRPIGTMGNVGAPARTAGENTYGAQPATDHPYGPDARAKARKKKRKKRALEEEKRRISVSPVKHTDGYVRVKPRIDLDLDSRTEDNRQWLDDEQERRARRADAGRLTLRPQDSR